MHFVKIVLLRGTRLLNLTLAGCDLPIDLHLLLVAHLIEQIHDLVVVDGSGVNIVECAVHLFSLHVHVLKNTLEIADATRNLHMFV